MSMEHYKAAARAGKKDLQNRTAQETADPNARFRHDSGTCRHQR